jgi:REP element-mobilizing transposase RayT
VGVPRPPRVELAGGIFHVASRGVAQQAIYRDDEDRGRFLGLLAEVVLEQRWRCLTYCLLGNHFHLVIQLRDANLSVGMQRLNGEHARLFNQRHARSGHLFQGRFWSKLVTRDAHLLELSRYVALNPVEANVCAMPDEWRWSAHRALIGEDPAGFVDVEAMLSYFNDDPDRGRTQYATLVAAGRGTGSADIDPRLRELATSCDRDEAIARARLELGYGIAEIATALDCHPKTVRRRLAAMSVSAPERP